MDQSLVHTFSWGNSYGPMVLKGLPNIPSALVLVHGWLFPESRNSLRSLKRDGFETLETVSRLRGKRVYTTTAGPLFSRSVARPRGHRVHGGVYFFLPWPMLCAGRQRCAPCTTELDLLEELCSKLHVQLLVQWYQCLP